jgi:hypothetical protein
VLFATLIYTFESGVYDEYRRQYVREDGTVSPFESIPGSIWWTIVTMTTVGYGDQFPVTAPGKVIAVLTMFSGLVVLSLPITIIGANFDDEYRELRKRTQDEKERARRRERALLRQQQQQAQEAQAAKGTPVRPAGKDAADGETPAPLTFPPSSPAPGSNGPVGEDPIKLIQTMIHDAHYSLTKEVEKLMVEHENKLRLQIKQVLRRHASGVVDARSTPLEQLRPAPSASNALDAEDGG